MISDVAYQNLERLAMADNKENGDYIGEDGLLYCGKCNTRKQHSQKWIDGSYKTVPVVCKCRKKEMEETEERMRKQEEMASIKRMRISSLMDEIFTEARFENYEVKDSNRKNYDIAKRYSERFEDMYKENQGLIFFGTVGTGKSYTAACIANYLLDRSTSVVMTSFVKILQQFQGFQKEAEEAYINRLNTARLLIIDDLGAERSTDYALERVYDVIDNRYRVKKPLVLTTNLTLGQMQQATDIRYERIYDRIFEMCYPLEFSGVSWRKREAAKRFDKMKKIMEV